MFESHAGIVGGGNQNKNRRMQQQHDDSAWYSKEDFATCGFMLDMNIEHVHCEAQYHECIPDRVRIDAVLKVEGVPQASLSHGMIKVSYLAKPDDFSPWSGRNII